MSRRGLTFSLAGILSLAMIVAATVLPVPYVVLVPGPVCDTLGSCYGKTVVQVPASAARSTPPDGHLFLTTVGVVPGDCNAQPSLWQAVRAWLDRSDAVQPQQAICPPGQTSAQVQQENERQMSQSQRDAVTAALLELGYHPTSKKIIVGDVSAGVPAAAVLRGGDVLQAVDGHPVTSASELRRLIRAHRPGDVVRLTIVRGGATRTVNVRTVATGTGADRHAAVGITPDLLATFDKPKVRFGISPSEVGGPSAGLMFTLGLIDKLSGQQLTGGRTIAGTGTIDGFGLVGPIGGIQQKIAAATSKRVGATVFLAPAGDCAEAKAAAPAGVTLVRVDTLKTALSALRAIRSGSEAFPRC